MSREVSLPRWFSARAKARAVSDDLVTDRREHGIFNAVETAVNSGR